MKTPEPQGYLNDDGKVIYFKLCELLEKYDAIETIDSFGLSQAAHWLWLFHDSAEAVGENGGKQITANGYSQVTAEITIMDKASARFEKLSAKYGLSPKDRELMLKFKVKKEEKDEIDELNG
jgi:phage terminase small subunit